ncbi:unnamed protein product [Amoebophrya sp. A25]|nr:unnamed protein product [Amoebophrya sp. A25]|eukprot:GSA25T00016233001.1
MFRFMNQQALQGLLDEQIRQIQTAGQAASTVLSFFIRIVWSVADRIIMPVMSNYEQRSCFIGFWQLLSCEQLQFLALRSLVANHRVYNLLHVGTLANAAPLAYAYYRISSAMPCPRIQQMIVRVALAALFAVAFAISYMAYKNFFLALGYGFVLPSWLAVASMLMQVQMHTRGNTTFNPLTNYPVMGLLGGVAQFFMLRSMKTLYYTDALMITFVMDHVSAAIVGSYYVSEERKEFHYKYIKDYALLLVLMMVYFYGERLPTEVGVADVGYEESIYIFAAARFILIARAMWVKKRIADFSGRAEIKFPSLENVNTLFVPRGCTLVSGFDTTAPRKHRFELFPQPVLWQMDALWDSGLMDDMMHGTGPGATIMIHVLSDFVFTAPFLAVMAWQFEFSTLAFGFLPPAMGAVAGVPIGTMAGEVQKLEADAKTAYLEEQMQSDVNASDEYPSSEVLKAVGYFLLYCAIKFMYPFTVSKSCFDRGSSPPDWAARPLYLAAVYFLYDVIILFAGGDAMSNRFPRFRLLVAISLFCFVALLRSNYYKYFKKKYYLLATRYLHYMQPSCVRSGAKELLVDFANNVAVEDYGNLLLDCVITHGNNLQQIAHTSGYRFWDPRPSATAAWKMAGSLVGRGIAEQKKKASRELNVKAQMIQWISDMIYQCASEAVDSATGHGKRYMLCAAHANVGAKERVFQRLRKLVQQSRTKKALVRDGTYARAPLVLATSRGILRPVGTVASMDDIKHLDMLKLKNRIKQEAFEKELATKYVCIPKVRKPAEVEDEDNMEAPVVNETATLRVQPPSDDGSAAKPSGSQLAQTAFFEQTSTEQTSSHLQSTSVENTEHYDVLAANAFLWSRIFRLAHEEMHGVARVETASETVGSSSDAGGEDDHTPGGTKKEDGTRPGSAALSDFSFNQLAMTDKRFADWRSLFAGRGMLTLSYHCIDSGKVPSAKAVVRGFGNGNEGQLGTSFRYRGETRPMDVERFHGKDVVGLQTGRAHSFCLEAQAGHVLGFGSNRGSCLGLRKEITGVNEPYLLRGTREEHVVQVATSTSGSHTLCLCNNGTVYSFGTSAVGALGIETDTIDPSVQGVSKFHERDRNAEGGKAKTIYHSTRPVLLRMTRTIPMKQVAVGARFSVMLDDTGVLYVFGDNSRGQLGIENMSLDTAHLHDTRKATATALEAQRVLARGSPIKGGTRRNPGLGEHPLFSKDFNNTDLMRVGSKMLPRVVTQPMALPEKRRWKQVVCGDEHVIALSEDDRFYGWGANSAGQLGIGKSTDQYCPHMLQRLSSEKWLMVACGTNHTLVITENKLFSENPRVAVMGSNAFGQLGLGREDPGRVWPTWLTLREDFGGYLGPKSKGRPPNQGYYFCWCAAAANHSFLVTRTGHLWCFGSNQHGQLGFPNDEGKDWVMYEPTLVTTMTHNVRMVSTAESHTLILGG